MPKEVRALIVLLSFCFCLTACADATTASSTTRLQASPTARPAPPTPTRTATQRQDAQIVALVNADTVNATASDDNGSITITDTWQGVSNNQVGDILAKQEIFNVMRDVWTHWKGTKSDVTVIIQGPPSLDATLFATAMLFADEAAHFDWPHLTAIQAWSMYDSAMSALG